MRAGVLLIGLCGLVAQTGGSGRDRWGVRTGGTALTALAPSGTRAVALFFVATDCPVSNRMFPEMRRLREEFASKGVQTWYVYPNTTERVAEIVAHQRAFDPGGEAIEDPAGGLVRLSRAVATPEMSVLVPDGQGWRAVYTGRIDDRFVRLGVERPAAREHFGEEALQAVVAGKTPKAAVGAPVGCAIVNPGVGR